MHMIAYVSEATFPEIAAKRHIKDIVSTAQKHNASQNITGVLFYENRHFVQVIEGQEDHLQSLYDKICSDNRHADVESFVDEAVGKRSFPDWSMDTFYVDSPSLVDRSIIKMLHELHSRMFTLSADSLITFTKNMVDELDIYKIKASTQIG